MLILADIFKGVSMNFESGEIKIGNVSINIYNGIVEIIKIIIIIFIMWLVIKIGNSIINKLIKRHDKSRFVINTKKSKTIAALTKSILRYSVYFFGISAILTDIFGTISLTFASIGGVAIGFGAQNIIKDVINGFFILLEDQFSVGDYINIEDKAGIVEGIEIRVTKIRDFNGDLHIIPNGLITKVTNHSRGAMRIAVDVIIAYEESIDKAIKVINNACGKFIKENKDIIEEPKVQGVTNFNSNGVTIKIQGKVKQMTQWKNENELRKIIKEEFAEAKIKVPSTKIEVIKEEIKNA